VVQEESGVAMGTKMGLFRGYNENKNISLPTTDQNLIFTSITSMTKLALIHPAEKNSTNLLPQSIIFTWL